MGVRPSPPAAPVLRVARASGCCGHQRPPLGLQHWPWLPLLRAGLIAGDGGSWVLAAAVKVLA